MSPSLQYILKWKNCYNKNPTVPNSGWGNFNRDNLIDFSGYSSSGAAPPASVTMVFPEFYYESGGSTINHCWVTNYRVYCYDTNSVFSDDSTSYWYATKGNDSGRSDVCELFKGTSNIAVDTREVTITTALFTSADEGEYMFEIQGVMEFDETGESSDRNRSNKYRMYI